MLAKSVTHDTDTSEKRKTLNHYSCAASVDGVVWINIAFTRLISMLIVGV